MSFCKATWAIPGLSKTLVIEPLAQRNPATLALAVGAGEAALSFLGLGIQEQRSASWRLMLSQTQNDIRVFMLNFRWLLTPGAAIFITVIAFNGLGDVLRDIVDPQIRF